MRVHHFSFLSIYTAGFIRPQSQQFLCFQHHALSSFIFLCQLLLPLVLVFPHHLSPLLGLLSLQPSFELAHPRINLASKLILLLHTTSPPVLVFRTFGCLNGLLHDFSPHFSIKPSFSQFIRRVNRRTYTTSGWFWISPSASKALFPSSLILLTSSHHLLDRFFGTMEP